MARVDASQHINFSGNECIGDTATDVNISLLSVLQADHVNASNNRLVGNGDNDVMMINSNKKLVAMGNMSTGNIRINGGGNLPAPWDTLNIII